LERVDGWELMVDGEEMKSDEAEEVLGLWL